MVNVVETRAGEVAYSDAGEGPVVVLLHAALHDRRDFDAIAPSLRHDHRVIALDWPGHGDSPAPSQPPTAALFADVLADVVAALDLPPAAFIGNSVGGFAAARLAITEPQRVSRLVLVNSGGFIASPVANLYCRTLGIPAVMKRVLPRFVRSYMKVTSDDDQPLSNACWSGRTPATVSVLRLHCGAVSPLPNTTYVHTPIASQRRVWSSGDRKILQSQCDSAGPPPPRSRIAAGSVADGPHAVFLRPRWIPGNRRAVLGGRTRQRAMIPCTLFPGHRRTVRRTHGQ